MGERKGYQREHQRVDEERKLLRRRKLAQKRRFRRRLIGVSMLILALCIALYPKYVKAAGDVNRCGANLTWKLEGGGTEKTLKISGSGKMYDYHSAAYGEEAPWKTEAENITSVIFENDGETTGITTVGERAFYQMRALKRVRLPETLTSLQASCFDSCSSLSEIAFPASLTEIGRFAFRDCTALEGHLILPDHLKTLSPGAFYGCKFIGGEIQIPSGITEIGALTFAGTGIRKILLNKVNTIGNYAFYDCKELDADLTIPNQVRSIGHHAFDHTPVRSVLFQGKAPLPEAWGESPFPQEQTTIYYEEPTAVRQSAIHTDSGTNEGAGADKGSATDTASTNFSSPVFRGYPCYPNAVREGGNPQIFIDDLRKDLADNERFLTSASPLPVDKKLPQNLYLHLASAPLPNSSSSLPEAWSQASEKSCFTISLTDSKEANGKQVDGFSNFEISLSLPRTMSADPSRLHLFQEENGTVKSLQIDSHSLEAGQNGTARLHFIVDNGSKYLLAGDSTSVPAGRFSVNGQGERSLQVLASNPSENLKNNTCLNVRDMAEADSMIAAQMEQSSHYRNFRLQDTYNISLQNEGGFGTGETHDLTRWKNFEIWLPLSDLPQEGKETVKVLSISEKDGKTLEEIPGTRIQAKEGKNYVVFTPPHFSEFGVIISSTDGRNRMPADGSSSASSASSGASSSSASSASASASASKSASSASSASGSASSSAQSSRSSSGASSSSSSSASSGASSASSASSGASASSSAGSSIFTAQRINPAPNDNASNFFSRQTNLLPYGGNITQGGGTSGGRTGGTVSGKQTDMPKTADADTYRILVILLLSLGGSIEILASFPGKKTEIA